MPSTQPIIEVQNLVAKYGDKTVLHDVSTRIFPSEVRVILGGSGCGKTTLLKHIIGLLKPFSGTIRVFGTPIGDLDSPETTDVLKRVGITYQNGALLGSLTVGENIALPLRMHTTLPESIIREMVIMKLSQVDMPHAADLYPGELSGGMRKRAAVARALAMDPPLLFCDEPSAGLDPVTSAGLDDLLLRLREALGITIVVVTHELLSIQTIADNIIFLHKGTLLFDGSLRDARALTRGPLYDFFERHAEDSGSDAAATSAPGGENHS
ncbi:MAG: ATP-binding cassette domain-containing protein [Chitinivibrionales bacterium]|nr:ATP-binding cassette domain-containing protein [Chitinivibrionales bacterium]MBD3394656.1 ATP-binding cassette domain-containing protein [Chitinivibrionales bacterium]